MAARKTKTPTTLVAFKGFNANLTCRDFQYAIGATYKHDGDVVRCASGGFHSCEMPLDVWGYYGPATSRFAEVMASGEIDRGDKTDDSKIASAEITIKAELRLPDLIKRAAEWIIAAAKSNIGTGFRGHAAATGDGGHAVATGYRGHAAATGYRGHAVATGDGGLAAAAGDGGHAVAAGYRGHAAGKGKNAIAAALGPNSTAQAAEGGWIVLAAYDDDWDVVAIDRARVGERGVEAGKTYRLTVASEFVEVEDA